MLPQDILVDENEDLNSSFERSPQLHMRNRVPRFFLRLGAEASADDSHDDVAQLYFSIRGSLQAFFARVGNRALFVPHRFVSQLANRTLEIVPHLS